MFPWYMSIILSPLAYITIYYVRNLYLFAILAVRTKSQQVLMYKPLRCDTNESLDRIQCSVGAVVGTSLWMGYGWVTRLRYGVLLYPTIQSRLLPYTPSDAPDNPAMHTAFLFLLVISVITLICKEFCDPGTCATLTKDALKPVRSISQKFYEKVSYIFNLHIDYRRPRAEKPL
jgi:hypothetical protein